MAEALGLIGSFLGGAGGAVENVMIRKIQGEIDDQKAQALEAARAANNMKLETSRQEAAEKQTRLADELRTAPGKKVAKDIAEANKPVMVDDGVGGGNMQAPTAAEQEENRLRAMESSGSEGLIGSAAQVRGAAADREQRAKDTEARSAQDERQHSERMAQTERQLKQQGAQISLEARKVDMLDQNNKLEKEDKAILRKARNDYQNETDPEKKAELGAQYLTLTGKIVDRWKPIETETVDPNTGIKTKTITGWMDTSTMRTMGPEGFGKRDAAVGKQEVRYDKDGNAFVRGPDGKPVPYKSGSADGQAKPVAGGTKPASKAPAAVENTAQSRYLKALAELNDLKGGLLMPTPRGNAAAIKAKEEEVNRLLQETYR